MTTISPLLLETPVTGLNLFHPNRHANDSNATLGEVLGNTPKLLVFVRHFGCIFCREMIADVRAAAEKDVTFPDVIFFYQGTAAQGQDFFSSLYPTAKAIADLPKVFYDGFGLQQGGMKEMFGAEVWACGIRAALKGHFIGAPIGDPWVMPGLFLVHHHRIVWQHDFSHAGDHPDWTSLPKQFLPLLQTTVSAV
jgi:hypothetical protein